jgi:hypothetical protein
MEIVATPPASLTRIEEVILEKLRANARMKGLDLLTLLSAEGYMESEVQRAMSDLLSSGKIELTSDRNLQYKAA